MDLIPGDIYTAICLFGVATYLVIYTCLQLGLVSGQSYLYAAVIILGAGSILVSLVENFHLPTAVIQTAFILISLVGMLRLYITENHILFSSEEQEFVSSKFPGLSKNLARKLLDRGCWFNSNGNAVLAIQGEELDGLVYMADGEAAIYVDGKFLRHSGKDCFIGEITVLEDTPANRNGRPVEAIPLLRHRQGRVQKTGAALPGDTFCVYPQFCGRNEEKTSGPGC